MARAPVRDIPLSAELRPVASPVDTYVRPAPSPLRGLADALAQTDRSLQAFLQTRDRKAEEEDALRGKAAFYNDHSGEFARAITEGKIPAQYSPFYVRAFKEAQGAAAGDKLRSDFQSWWDNWEGKDSEDPDAFNKGFRQFLSDKLGTNDPDVLRGVLPQVEALQANATTQYTQYRHDKTVKGSLTAHGALISGAVQDGVDEGLVSDKGTDYKAIFGNVNKVVSESLAKGDPDGKAVDTFVDVMSAKILETRDPKLLDWFDEKVPGKDYTYGQTPHGLEVKNATVNSLESIARQRAAGLSAAERQEMERLKDQAQAGIVDGILSNPSAPFDEKLLEQAKKNGDPLIEVHARQWREDLLKGKSDPAKLTAFYDDVVSGRVTPKQAFDEARAHGVFGTPEDYRTAASFVQSYQTSEKTITETLNGQVARQVLEAIRQRTVAVDPTTMNPLSGTSDEGFEATSDFRQLVTRWIVNNPKATLPEIEEQVTKFGKMITDRFKAPDDPFTSGATYERDSALPFGNAYDQAKPAEGDAAAAEPKPDNTAAVKPTPEDEEQARRRGMGVEEYLQQKQQQEGQDGSLLKKISYDPNDTDMGEGDHTSPVTVEQATEWIDQVFERQAALNTVAPDADTQTRSLLDLIGKAEAAGNYNAVYGNAHNTVDLGQFTLDQVLGFQQDARRRGKASTAIGRYQFIYKTLRGLKAEMGLSGSERFTPDLQDKLGIALLNRRGLQAFRSGRISKRQFALSLSQEWAGLPNPNTGRSFYHGDGLNASTVGTAKVFEALGMPVSLPSSTPEPAVGGGDPYANIPDTDGTGAGGQRQKFLEWNSDPVANHEANLQSLDPTLANVIRKAQEYSPIKIVIGSGKRDPALQKKAVEWGWSKTNESDHLHGGAVDLWALDDKGAVSFDAARQKQIVKAMKRAAKELGVELDVGADWKKFKDNPHFALKGLKV